MNVFFSDININIEAGRGVVKTAVMRRRSARREIPAESAGEQGRAGKSRREQME